MQGGHCVPTWPVFCAKVEFAMVMGPAELPAHIPQPNRALFVCTMLTTHHALSTCRILYAGMIGWRTQKTAVHVPSYCSGPHRERAAVDDSTGR